MDIPSPAGAGERDAAIAALAARFGERLSTSAAIRAEHGCGEAYHQPCPPDAVLFARSTEEVMAAVAICARHRMPIIAFGAGTSLEGNFAALHGGVCLDLSGMNRILDVRSDDLDCTVEAGVTRVQLNEHLRDTGLFFPIDPGAVATIGGMAATRASGTSAVRYGTMRENVVALEVVLADGSRITSSRRARKSAAGYDLTRLFVGSEGTLGIITRVTLRLYGRPESLAAAVCPFESLAGAIRTVTQLIQLGVPLGRVEFVDKVQMAATNRWSGSAYPETDTLFFEFQGSPAAVEEQIECARSLAGENGGGAFRWAETTEGRSQLWKARHEALYAALALKPGAKAWTTDVCVPIGSLESCVLDTRRDIDSSDLAATMVGHVGDGNFHVVFLLDPDRPEDLAEARRLNARLVARAIALDGTCTGEHGIGSGKIDALEAELGDAVELMRRVKRSFDPDNILNPGKILRL